MIRSVIVTSSFGLILGIAGSFFSIDERISKNNRELKCDGRSEVRDSYRHVFGKRVDYCRTPDRVTW